MSADIWNGKKLASRRDVPDADLNYRLYNALTGELLSFGSVTGPGALAGLVHDVLRTQAEHPGVKLCIRHVDGPAY